jgi:hypothetical protein
MKKRSTEIREKWFVTNAYIYRHSIRAILQNDKIKRSVEFKELRMVMPKDI